MIFQLMVFKLMLIKAWKKVFSGFKLAVENNQIKNFFLGGGGGGGRFFVHICI